MDVASKQGKHFRLFYELTCCGFKDIQADTPQEAVSKAYTAINSMNIDMDHFRLNTEDGNAYQLRLEDVDFGWNDVSGQ
jgi:ribosomal protein S4E